MKVTILNNSRLCVRFQIKFVISPTEYIEFFLRVLRFLRFFYVFVGLLRHYDRKHDSIRSQFMIKAKKHSLQLQCKVLTSSGKG